MTPQRRRSQKFFVFKAEIDINGRALSQLYLDDKNMDVLLEVRRLYEKMERKNQMKIFTFTGSARIHVCRTTERIHVDSWRTNC